jgi:hypothetical protein
MLCRSISLEQSMRISINPFMIVSCFFRFPALFAQQEPPAARIPQVSLPPKLEDLLTNTPREAELKITDFHQFDPGDGDAVGRPSVLRETELLIADVGV